MVNVFFIDCKEETNQTASVVAKKMYISEATLSGHVERLLKQKYIIKKVDETNRRKSIINLTEKGKKEFQKTKKIVEMELDRILNTVKTEDRKHVLDAFNDILIKLKQYIKYHHQNNWYLLL